MSSGHVVVLDSSDDDEDYYSDSPPRQQPKSVSRSAEAYMKLLSETKVASKKPEPRHPGPGASKGALEQYRKLKEEWEGAMAMERDAERLQLETLRTTEIARQKEIETDLRLSERGVIGDVYSRSPLYTAPGPLRDFIQYTDPQEEAYKQAVCFSLLLPPSCAAGLALGMDMRPDAGHVVVEAAPEAGPSAARPAPKAAYDHPHASLPCHTPLYPFMAAADGEDGSGDFGGYGGSAGTGSGSGGSGGGSGTVVRGNGLATSASASASGPQNAFQAMRAASIRSGGGAGGGSSSSRVSSSSSLGASEAGKKRDRAGNVVSSTGASASASASGGSKPSSVGGAAASSSHSHPSTSGGLGGVDVPLEYRQLLPGDRIIAIGDVDLRRYAQAVPSAAAVAHSSSSSSSSSGGGGGAVELECGALRKAQELLLSAATRSGSGILLRVARFGEDSLTWWGQVPDRPDFLGDMHLPSLRAAVVTLLKQERTASRSFPAPADQYFNKVMTRLDQALARVQPQLALNPSAAAAASSSSSSSSSSHAPPLSPQAFLHFVQAEADAVRVGMAAMPSKPGGVPDILLQGYVPPSHSSDGDVMVLQESAEERAARLAAAAAARAEEEAGAVAVDDD